MNSLPEEILTEILVKLPAVSLLSCRGVCKTWQTLIRSPGFVCHHLNYNIEHRMLYVRTSNQDMLLTYDQNKLHLLLRPLELPSNKIYTSGSCNGILCFSDYLGTQVCLCNPVTGEYFILPTSTLTSTLAPMKGPLIELGFGFDESTKDYKIVTIFGNPKLGCIEIFKFSTNCWSRVEHNYCDIEFARLRFSIGSGVFFNGILHWWIRTNINLKFTGIVTFDLHAERFGRIGCPNLNKNSRSKLTVLGGHSLALVSEVEMGAGYRFEVWVMEEHGNHESWTKKCKVSPSSLGPYWHQLTCWNGDDVVLVNLDRQKLVSPHTHDLVSCKLVRNVSSALEVQCKAVDIVHTSGTPFKSHTLCTAISFQPSLVSIR